VYPPASVRADLFSYPIYLHHPSAQHDLQSPLAIQTASPATNPILVDNYYIIGVHSSNFPKGITYDVFLFLSNYNDTNT
jgi:hypothetical protein